MSDKSEKVKCIRLLNLYSFWKYLFDVAFRNYLRPLFLALVAARLLLPGLPAFCLPPLASVFFRLFFLAPFFLPPNPNFLSFSWRFNWDLLNLWRKVLVFKRCRKYTQSNISWFSVFSTRNIRDRMIPNDNWLDRYSIKW